MIREVLLVFNTVALSTYYLYAASTITFKNKKICISCSRFLAAATRPVIFQVLTGCMEPLHGVIPLVRGSGCTNNYSALHVQVGYVIKQNRRYICTISIDLAYFIILCVMNATTSPHLHQSTSNMTSTVLTALITMQIGVFPVTSVVIQGSFGTSALTHGIHYTIIYSPICISAHRCVVAIQVISHSEIAVTSIFGV